MSEPRGLEAVLQRHVLVWDGLVDAWYCGKTAKDCDWRCHISRAWRSEAEDAHRAHLAAEVRAWLTSETVVEALTPVLLDQFGFVPDRAGLTDVGRSKWDSIARAALAAAAEHRETL